MDHTEDPYGVHDSAYLHMTPHDDLALCAQRLNGMQFYGFTCTVKVAESL